jgi:hypothetical protein
MKFNKNFLKFVISISGSHCDCSPRASRDLVTPLAVVNGSGSIKRRKFDEQLRKQQLVKDPAPWIE